MILVTGGTGFVGQEVVKELLSLGYKVRLLVRDPHRARQWGNNPNVELIKGDVLRPETLPAAMTGVQAVIHLVGILVETPKISFNQAHVEATRNLLAAAREAGVTRWLQMSAAGTRPYASSQYHLTKWQAEELVRASGFDWTILRPSMIYGYDERDRLIKMIGMVLSWPFNFLTLYSFPLLDGGRPKIQPVNVREVAHCFAHGVSKSASVGKTFELVGPVALTWREMVTTIAAVLGKSAGYEEIPLLVAMRIFLWMLVVLIPLVLILGLCVGKMTWIEAEAGTALWVVLAVVAGQWRQLILFNVPGEPLRMIGDGLDPVLPQGLRFGGLLKMAGEDNIGDPQPASEVFAYQPESFEQGVRKVLRRK